MGRRGRFGAAGIAAAGVVAAIVAGCLADNRAGDVSGRGKVIHYLSGCLGVNLESGDAAGRTYGIAFWPPGYTTKFAHPDSPEIADASGATVVRVGDVIDVHLHVVIETGDTPCGNTAVATVTDFAPAPSPAASR